MGTYDRQSRGDAEGYAAYFAGMDRSMQQKVALTTAHFPPRGTLADMGSGSGRATFDLANLYAGLSVVGVDVAPEAVAHASRTFQRPNLRYAVGDIADPLFPAAHLDGILDSSVLHHVTSFNGFSTARVEDLLDHQVAALRVGGVLIIRDFVVPRGPAQVDLELPDDDGARDGAPPALSTAALLERFARDFRSSVNREGPVPFTALPSTRPGWRRFRLAWRAATEFILRKDYRDHWDTELLEEYTYFTQDDFERALRRRGLRIVVACDLHNPWIVDNRFRGRVAVSTVDGKPLMFPPTNFLVVGEKTAPGQGVELVERARRSLPEPAFLSLERFRHVGNGRVFELAARPHRTLDVLPWFEDDGRLHVLARHGFPRPVVNAATGSPDLLGLHGAGFITEPLAAIVEDGLPERAAVERLLLSRAGIAASDVHEVSAPARYFTSPGGLNERVDACLARVSPWREERAAPNTSPFTTGGTVRFLDATQVLRASHVGGMFDARLEINIYRLCLAQGRAVGPWIGADLAPAEASRPRAAVDVEQVLAVPVRRAFEPVGPGPCEFLDVVEGEFDELDAAGAVLRTARFEYVLPRTLGRSTASVLPLMRTPGGLLVGLETRDLPAVQAFEATSALLVVPACRLPRDVVDLAGCEAHAVRQFEREFALRIRRLVPLGGRYHPSTGVTPEVVYPYAAEVDAQDDGARPLQWVRLDALVRGIDRLRDAHLLVSVLRAAHATGVLRQS